MPKKNGSGEFIVIDGKDGEMVNKEKMIDGLKASSQKEKGEKMARNKECNDVIKGEWVQMRNNETMCLLYTTDNCPIWSLFVENKLFHKKKALNEFFCNFLLKIIIVF